jgi:hypothetical protein
MARRLSSLVHARSAKARALRELAEHPLVNGVGIGRERDGYFLKVNLAAPLPRGESLPAEINGFPIRVEVIGRVSKRIPA